MLTWSTNAVYFQLGSEDDVDETSVLGQSHLCLLALHMEKYSWLHCTLSPLFSFNVLSAFLKHLPNVTQGGNQGPLRNHLCPQATSSTIFLIQTTVKASVNPAYTISADGQRDGSSQSPSYC